MKTKVLALLGTVFLLGFFIYYAIPSFADYGKEYRLEKRFPEPLGYVSDYDSVFTPIQRTRLEKRLTEYEKETTREIAVTSFTNLSTYSDILEFATDLGNEWGVGKEENNNGLLIVFSKELKQVGIATGYGTEKILTDSICQLVIDKTILPYFREGNYFDGIEVGLDELMAHWK